MAAALEVDEVGVGVLVAGAALWDGATVSFSVCVYDAASSDADGVVVVEEEGVWVEVRSASVRVSRFPGDGG